MLRQSQSRPNILLITMDQLRYDYVGAYQPEGQRFMDTPCMDALAQNGCLYTHAYSPNPVCIPARYNLITGLTPGITALTTTILEPRPSPPLGTFPPSPRSSPTQAIPLPPSAKCTFSRNAGPPASISS